MIKRKFILFFCCLFFIFVPVYANTIDKIDMDIYIDDNGNGNITEKWYANVDSGTELYHPYYNIGDAVISDLSAYIDDTEYKVVNKWNINASLQEKAYKASIYKAYKNEYDICAGISEYGRHVYTLKYKINGMVVKLNDADMLYWNLFPENFNTNPSQVNITISGDFVRNNVDRMYGYGKKKASFYAAGDTIIVNSNGKVSKNEYITLLIRFNKNTFNTSNIINNDFAYYQNKGNNNLEKTSDDSNHKNFFKFVNNIAIFMLPMVFTFIVFISSLLNNGVHTKDNYIGGYLKCKFGKKGNEVPSKITNYYRDIPNKGDIYRSFWIAGNYGLMKKREDFMGAILLKWLLNGNITFKESNKIELLKSPDNVIELESKLYGYFLGASVKNILDYDSFKKWCMLNPSQMYHWFTEVIDYETTLLAKEGKAEFKKKDDMYHSIYYEISDEMMDEAIKIAEFKKFLNDLTLMNEKDKIEVKLWKEYLIYAQMFGLADKIAEHFNKLYPELIEEITASNINIKNLKAIAASSTYIVKTSSKHSSSYTGGGSSRGSGYLSNSSSSPSSFSSGGGGGSFGSGGHGSSGGGFR